ncbi:MAG: lysozyme [Alphaproteobacteria bacterium]|nr:MAG: lysozyme [Alphaproteobacteria bacterium]
MKAISLLVVHCSATPASRDIGVAEIRAMHKRQGWADVGYHYVIRRDGQVEKGRADTVMGAHVAGHNNGSLGICLVGGVKPDMTAETNFTPLQYQALEELLATLTRRYPAARVCGHRDLSPDRNGDGKVVPGEWVKACPTFDVAAWWAGVK